MFLRRAKDLAACSVGLRLLSASGTCWSPTEACGSRNDERPQKTPRFHTDASNYGISLSFFRRASVLRGVASGLPLSPVQDCCFEGLQSGQWPVSR